MLSFLHLHFAIGCYLFSTYTLPLGAIFSPLTLCHWVLSFLHLHFAIGCYLKKHNLQYHLYADDTQLYVDLSGMQDGEATAVDRIERCIEEARQWMSDHNLLLNDNKTEAIIITAPNRKHLQDVLFVCGCNIVPSPTIHNIGITIDCGLTMSSHVSRMCKAAFKD